MHNVAATIAVLLFAALLLTPQILNSRVRRRRWQRRAVGRALSATVALSTVGRNPVLEFTNHVRGSHFPVELRRYALELPEDTPLRDLLEGSLPYFKQPDWQHGVSELVAAIDSGEEGDTLRDHAKRIDDEINRAVEAEDLSRNRLMRWIVG